MLQFAVGPWSTILETQYCSTTLPMAVEDSLLPLGPPPPRPVQVMTTEVYTQTDFEEVTLTELVPISPTLDKELELGIGLMNTLIKIELMEVDEDGDDDDSDLKPAFPPVIDLPNSDDDVFEEEVPKFDPEIPASDLD